MPVTTTTTTRPEVAKLVDQAPQVADHLGRDDDTLTDPLDDARITRQDALSSMETRDPLAEANDLATRMDADLAPDRGLLGSLGHALSHLVPTKAWKAARTASSGRKEAVKKQTHDIGNTDIVIERMAHKGAYGSLDAGKLPSWGYREARVVYDETTGFRAVLYLPTSEALDGTTAEGQLARTIHGGAPPPVLAFRGTKDSKGATDDTNREGVGAYQIAAHDADIKALLAEAGGKVVATGHSLGGALAQLCAARHASAVSRIVTFQAPAIDAADAAKVDEHNEAHPDEAIASTHYRAQGDLVHMAGEQLTPGDVYTFESAGIANPLDHTIEPLARLNALRGNLVPNIDGQDRLTGVTREDETVKGDAMARFSEGTRKKLGGVMDREPMEHYARLWSSVEEMRSTGQFSEDYLRGVIDDADTLDDAAKARMKSNL